MEHCNTQTPSCGSCNEPISHGFASCSTSIAACAMSAFNLENAARCVSSPSGTFDYLKYETQYCASMSRDAIVEINYLLFLHYEKNNSSETYRHQGVTHYKVDIQSHIENYLARSISLFNSLNPTQANICRDSKKYAVCVLYFNNIKTFTGIQKAFEKIRIEFKRKFKCDIKDFCWIPYTYFNNGNTSC